MYGDLPLILSVPSAVGPLLRLSCLLGQREDTFAASSCITVGWKSSRRAKLVECFGAIPKESGTHVPRIEVCVSVRKHLFLVCSGQKNI